MLLYNQSGKTAMEWQSALIYDIMATDSEGLWVHAKFGYSVPRRNGKSEILIMRCIWGILHGEQILYTTHRVTTSSSAWDKMVKTLSKMGFTDRDDFKTLKYVVTDSRNPQTITCSASSVTCLSRFSLFLGASFCQPPFQKIYPCA
ncbi:MAG: hypothetical protein LUE12_09890 [Ruminococcus sp.]|nr:hypothetical protein [Ruminococcus sp.]